MRCLLGKECDVVGMWCKGWRLGGVVAVHIVPGAAVEVGCEVGEDVTHLLRLGSVPGAIENQHDVCVRHDCSSCILHLKQVLCRASCTGCCHCPDVRMARDRFSKGPYSRA